MIVTLDRPCPECDCPNQVNQTNTGIGRHIYLTCQCGHTEDITVGQLIAAYEKELKRLRCNLLSR